MGKIIDPAAPAARTNLVQAYSNDIIGCLTLGRDRANLRKQVSRTFYRPQEKKNARQGKCASGCLTHTFLRFLGLR